jgi:hypothetical protein
LTLAREREGERYQGELKSKREKRALPILVAALETRAPNGTREEVSHFLSSLPSPLFLSSLTSLPLSSSHFPSSFLFPFSPLFPFLPSSLIFLSLPADFGGRVGD